ncbi:hypothetical protein [Rummeliibacillus pycnus]|uniref:hypothetical protein n=1 Tax=Rummeliibacillus pycnus TaxID=101070 RepID=UPI003D2B26A9
MGLSKKNMTTEENLDKSITESTKKTSGKRKKYPFKEGWSNMRFFYPAIQIVVMSIVLGSIVSIYMYLLSKNLLMTFIFFIIASIMGFYSMVYIPKQIEYKQNNLRALQRYTTNMTFYLQAGYNVLDSLKACKAQADGILAEDIEMTIVGLKRKAILYTDHFKKYHFDGLDVYHEILQIMYKHGGDPKALFDKPTKSINMELVYTDKLFKRKRNVRKQVYGMMGLSASMPLFVVFGTKDVYNVFLDTGFAAQFACVLYCCGFLISLYRLQKNALDISIF